MCMAGMIHCDHDMASLERRVAIDAARAAGAEERIVRRLLAAFPDDGILAEERGAEPGRSGRRWIIDPLDGTTNYAHALPMFSVSIALETERRIQLGVVCDPNLDELYVAERGSGATVNDQRPPPSPTPTLPPTHPTTP